MVTNLFPCICYQHKYILTFCKAVLTNDYLFFRCSHYKEIRDIQKSPSGTQQAASVQMRMMETFFNFCPSGPRVNYIVFSLLYITSLVFMFVLYCYLMVIQLVSTHLFKLFPFSQVYICIYQRSQKSSHIKLILFLYFMLKSLCHLDLDLYNKRSCCILHKRCMS